MIKVLEAQRDHSRILRGGMDPVFPGSAGPRLGPPTAPPNRPKRRSGTPADPGPSASRKPGLKKESPGKNVNYKIIEI